MRLAVVVGLFLGCGVLLEASVARAGDIRCDAPQVLVVLDKSSSMLGTLPDGGTKWDAAQRAIDEVTTAFADRIDFGLLIFPDPAECGPGSVVVDCGPGAAADIRASLGDPPPEYGNYTPMAESITVAGEYSPLSDPTRRSYVLLITDGWQWCAPYDPETRFLPVDAVQVLHDDRAITTYVVGFGGEVDVATLNRSAAVGGAAIDGCNPDSEDIEAANNCYYQTDDLESLQDALDTIARSVTEEVCDGFDNDCNFLIDETFDNDADGYTSCGGADGIGADCDDDNDAAHPGHEEDCDGFDNDCDGTIDLGCDCLNGQSQACGVCALGTQHCERGSWQDCELPGEPPAESCNGLDDDCDGTIDDKVTCPEDGFACRAGQCVDPNPPAPPEPEPDPDPDPDPAPDPEPEAEPEPDVEPDPGPAYAPQTIDGGCSCRTQPGAPLTPSERGTPTGLARLSALLMSVVALRRRGRRA